jgi:hypothetical protein
MADFTKIAKSRLGEVRFPKVDSPPGEVVTYRLSPEELEEIRRKYKTEPIKKPIGLRVDYEDYWRRKKEESKVEVKPALTKEYVEGQLAVGKSASQVERELGLTRNSIYYHMKKWGLKSPIGKKKSVEPVKEQVETMEKRAEPKIESKSEEVKAEITIDNVNHPPHYNQGSIEVIDYIQDQLTPEQFTGFIVGNVIKYASRARHKGGLEDLKKARWYLDRLIQQSELAKVE